jgi:hypothetical protein
MPTHWDWALQQGLKSNLNHFTFLPDRWIFMPGALETIGGIATGIPSKIICYMHDRVEDQAKPVRLHQLEWTGNLFEVTSGHLLSLVANSVIWDSSFPRMLNCIVPRVIINKLNVHFGNVFASIAPDWNFCFRALRLEDSIIFFDKAILLHYAQDRSNGQSMTRGVKTEDSPDFLPSAPIPEVTTVWNAIIHEYYEVKRATNSPKFPELEMTKYLQALALGITLIEDPHRRREMETILRSHGSPIPEETTSSNRTTTHAEAASSGYRVNSNAKKRDRIGSVVTRRSAQSIRLYLGKYFGIRPPHGNRFEFETTEQAIDYAIRFPRFPRRNWREGKPPEELFGSVGLHDVVSVHRPERIAWKLQRLFDRHVLWRLRT